MEIGADSASSRGSARGVRLMDYVIGDSSDDTSSLVLGCHLFVYGMIGTIALFDLQQGIYETRGDFVDTATVTLALAATGYADYFSNNFLGDDDFAKNCINRFGTNADALNYFVDAFSGGNFSKQDQDCSNLIFGVDVGDTDICNKVEIQAQFEGGTDEALCGSNSLNYQGCLAGFYKRKTDDDGLPMTDNGQGPATACPAGFWCPKDFTCKIPCPYGSLCVPSELTAPDNADIIKQQQSKCAYIAGVIGKTKPQNIYDVAQSSCTTDSTDDKAFTVTCPGVAKVPLCPAGFYCPTTSTIYDCPRGHYCPRGTFDPIKCALKVGCTKKGQAYPLIFAPVLIGFSIFVVVCVVLFTTSTSFLNRKRIARRMKQHSKVVERMQKRKVSTRLGYALWPPAHHVAFYD